MLGAPHLLPHLALVQPLDRGPLPHRVDLRFRDTLLSRHGRHLAARGLYKKRKLPFKIIHLPSNIPSPAWKTCTFILF